MKKGFIIIMENFENFSFFNSNNTLPHLSSLDTQFQDLKHFFEGYREMMLTHLIGEQALEDMGVDVQRYSPESARRVSYEHGWQRAQFDINLTQHL